MSLTVALAKTIRLLTVSLLYLNVFIPAIFIYLFICNNVFYIRAYLTLNMSFPNGKRKECCVMSPIKCNLSEDSHESRVRLYVTSILLKVSASSNPEAG